MTRDWLQLQAPAVLVTVAEVKGSSPRNVGARMWVFAEHSEGTIGDGQLEFAALAAARSNLGRADFAMAVSYGLGPDLGQCCGGRVTLLFEAVTPECAWLAELRSQLRAHHALVREVQFAPQRHTVRLWMAGMGTESSIQAWEMLKTAPFASDRRGASGHFYERITQSLTPIYVFGAGHVGRALVHNLAPLPCAVRWVDARQALFPDALPVNVQAIWDADPEALIQAAPKNSVWIVMTHDHDLDEQLTHAILSRNDFAYFGLIGSKTKRQRFEHRLRQAGIAADVCRRMVCPIGLPGIRSKDPAMIALGVAAQVFEVLEADTRPEVLA